MDTYRLHYFPESGNSYKLALMLTLCGQTFEPIWTDFGSRVTWTPQWRRTVNPMGEIPVLEVNGQKLTQTAPILLQLAAQYEKFGATNDAETYELLRWLFWDNQKMSGGMATYRFLRTFTPKSDPAVLAWHLARVKDYLGILEQHLGATTFVACERLTIADISMCAYLSYPMDETGIDLTASYPNITAWLDRLMKMPGWKLPYELLPGKRLQRWSA
jgi:glutathione S-transferase